MVPDLTAVERYLQDRERTPFFLFAGGSVYAQLRHRLQGLGLHLLTLSSLSSEEDRLPLPDDIVTTIKTKVQSGEKILLIGLAEYLALCGEEAARRLFSRLKSMPCGDGAALLLLRGFFRYASELSEDPRIANGERRLALRRSAEDAAEDSVLGMDVSLSVLPPEIPVEVRIHGARSLLAALEQGRDGTHIVQSRQSFPHALLRVHHVRDAFGVISHFCEAFAPLRSCGTEAEWQRLLQELSKEQWKMSAVFAHYGLHGDLAQLFHERTNASDFDTWLYFIALRLAGDDLAKKYPYLFFAAQQAESAAGLRTAVIHAISNISLQNPEFQKLYQERKRLLHNCSEAEMAEFVRKNRRIRAERIYRLTDLTEVEREDMIAALSHDADDGYDDWKNCGILQTVYPSLYAYASDYVFKDCARAAELTEYFIAYKRQKLSNCLEEMFLSKVDALAAARIYNEFPARESLLDGVPQEGTHLFWLDALGVEYLALIGAFSKQLGLKIRVQVGRAMLPTITSVNRAFYAQWQGSKAASKRLDDLKHGEESRYNYTLEKHPIHLAKEIDVIEEMLRDAATQLAAGKCRRFVIVSDHGASRLAVRREKEEKYETDTRGEHSGRCCRMFPNYAHDLPFATEEGDYLVLADYGRFKGSRKASVEVHGGASLEEVLVPLITLERADRQTVHVSLADENVFVDRKTGLCLALFADAPISALGIVWQGKFYAGQMQDAQHFVVQILDLTHAGTYTLAVYEGDTPLNVLVVEVQSKGMKMNDDFDF